MRVSVAAKALLDICHLESPAQELGDKLREKGAARKESYTIQREESRRIICKMCVRVRVHARAAAQE